VISVVITCCSRDRDLVERASSSVEWQLADGDEMLVFDDRGLGISHARNAGWQAAANPWVKYLDVDDLLAPFALEALRKAAAEISPEIQVLAGGQFVVHNGMLLDYQEPPARADISAANPFLVSHSLIRRTALEAVGGFDERIAFEEDWDLWLRIYSEYGTKAFGLINVPICFYIIDDERRAETERTRNHKVDGIDVREYFRRTYGIEATG
jgi:glycosyltransferase involved in cell wall biosynthesis